MLQVEKFVSADGHLTEPDDLWVTRMEARFRDRAPRVVDRNGAPEVARRLPISRSPWTTKKLEQRLISLT